MDSDEDSRPGSSASGSSSSSNSGDEASFRNSRSGSRSKSPASRSSSTSSQGSSPKSPVNGQSRSPSPNDGEINNGIGVGGDIMTMNDRKIRSMSPDDEEENRSRSASKESIRSASKESVRSASKDSIRSASSDDDDEDSASEQRNIQRRSVSRNQSISPVRKSNSKSSRNSSISSVSKSSDVSDGAADSDSDNDGDEDGHSKKNGSELTIESKHTPEALNISHEDLSDVSELDSAGSENENDREDEKKEESDDNENDDDKEDENEMDKSSITDLRQKLDERKNHLKSLEHNDENHVAAEVDGNHENNIEKDKGSPMKSPIAVVASNSSESPSDLLEKKNDEDALDFEAEEGECNDNVVEDKNEPKENQEKKETDGEVEDGEELEEGEVSDEDEKRPEETEPKPVCRFYTRGQCTWGMNCRFLHPGVTDKGNYTMFDMIRPVPVPHGGAYGPSGYHDFRNDRPPLHHGPPVHHHGAGFGMHPHTRPPAAAEPVVESAWERGLRTAKEMMRKANKRKEQDMDFEDKKMNLSASQDELEKDNYYIRDRASPEESPKYPKAHFEGAYSPPPKYPPRAMPAYDEDPYGRSARYRELPPHRMPQYEDEIMGKRRIRPAREVIVQRAEPVGRGDEWNDPWMRSKSPGRDKRSRRDRRSYSSNSSYSSSSTSESRSSSNTSRSPSPRTRRRQYSSAQSGHKSPVPRRHIKRSPSPPVKRRHSPAHAAPIEANYDSKKDFRNHSANKKAPIVRRSPVARKRNISPALSDKRGSRVSSPPAKRKRPSPTVLRKAVRAPTPEKIKKKRRSSSSASGSSDSSGSDSESSYTSSSSGSSRPGRTSAKVAQARPREKTALERKVVNKKVEMAKKRSPVLPIEHRTPPVVAPAVAAAAAASASAQNSKKTTRREELLKQLKAVEDAIARKRSKLN